MLEVMRFLRCRECPVQLMSQQIDFGGMIVKYVDGTIDAIYCLPADHVIIFGYPLV